MRLHSLAYVVLALLVVGGTFPTGAVPTGAVDDVFEENGIVLKPAPGPNGKYASTNENGNLTIRISDPGVLAEGVTVIRKVFVIKNAGDERTKLWLTHDAQRRVTLYESVSSGVLDETAINQSTIQGQENAITMGPGERVAVSMRINTRGPEITPGDTLLTQITLHTRQRGTPTATPQPAPAPTATPQPAPAPTATPQPTPTPTATPQPTPAPASTAPAQQLAQSERTVSVTIPGPSEPTVTVQELSPEQLPSDPGQEPLSAPRAIITSDIVVGQDLSPEQQADLEARGIDTVVPAGQPVTLDGTASIVDSTPGVTGAQRKRIVRAVDISPASSAVADKPGTVRIEVSRAKLRGTDPEAAQIGHMTESGWQLLSTEVAATTESSVVLEARTPGFSPFAVFVDPDVTYTWTLPDGSSFQGRQIRQQFDDPGIYNVTLTVTDALGNSNSTQHRILANDQPRVSIQRPETVTANETVTLRADVTNRFGNETVTWELPDGSEATGRTINYTFEQGQYDVEATVEDEYGATGTAEESITVGAAEPQQRLRAVGDQFPVLAWLLLIGAAILLFALLRRSGRIQMTLPRLGLVAAIRRRGAPRITELDNPVWNTDAGRFEIGALRVEDPRSDLETVEISVQTDTQTEIARKTIELDREGVYEAAPESIPGIGHPDGDGHHRFTVHVRVVDTRDNHTSKTEAVRLTRERWDSLIDSTAYS